MDFESAMQTFAEAWVAAAASAKSDEGSAVVAAAAPSSAFFIDNNNGAQKVKCSSGDADVEEENAAEGLKVRKVHRSQISLSSFSM